jgi:sugar phosphate isomerase/epimerase
MNIEERSIEEAIRLAGEKIGHFHVADSNRLAPGMGHLDFVRILGALRDTGYMRYVSAEIQTKPDFEAAAKITISTLRRALEVLE